MGRGVKLGLGGLGFLLTNGTAFFTLKNSFHSSDSFENPNWQFAGGGKPQTKKEKTLKLDFAKKKENDLPIVSAKQDTLPEVKLELESEKSELDVTKDLFDYSTNSVSSKVKGILLEIEKESRVNKQKEKIQEFEDLAKSVKEAIPKVFDRLISGISQTFSAKNREAGDGQSSGDSSGGQATATSTPSRSSMGDTQEQQLEETEEREGEGDGKQLEGAEERGNCNIVPSIMKEILQEKKLESEYYSVLCIKEDVQDEGEGDFGKRWGGAFPKILFKLSNLTELRKLDIKVKINYDSDAKTEGYLFPIEFESSRFCCAEDTKVIGDVKYEEEPLAGSNGTGAIVKLTTFRNEELIYLFMNLEDNSD